MVSCEYLIGSFVQSGGSFPSFSHSENFPHSFNCKTAHFPLFSRLRFERRFDSRYFNVAQVQRRKGISPKNCFKSKKTENFLLLAKIGVGKEDGEAWVVWLTWEKRVKGKLLRLLNVFFMFLSLKRETIVRYKFDLISPLLFVKHRPGT